LSRGALGGVAAVKVDESMRELPLSLRELQPVRFQLTAARVSPAHCLPFCNENTQLFPKGFDASHRLCGFRHTRTDG
jgi:hypothetical protein